MNRFATSLVSLCVAASAALLAPAVQAEELAPDVLIKNVSTEVLAVIKSDKDLQSGNTQKAVQLVEQKVLPHFNFPHMTQMAVGQAWRTASPEQKKTLTNEFRNLLVRTYSNALTAYKDQTIDFKPFRMQAADTDVTVRTSVKQSGGKSIPIDYSLEKLPEGWKVYDVIVAEVSLVTNYRSTFNQEIQTAGIDGLIKSLANKNKQLETAAKGDKK